MYDTPITVTSEGEFVPKLATDWTLSDDGLTWTVTLRDDATFHDGEPLDADDVAFSVEFFRDNEFPLLTSYAEPFVDVNVVDATTIELTTEDELPEVIFTTNLYAIYILPEHIWASEDPQEFGNEEMVGSGPFTFVEAQQGEFVELAGNPDYWGTVPAIDGVIFQTHHERRRSRHRAHHQPDRLPCTNSRQRRSRHWRTPRTWSSTPPRRPAASCATSSSTSRPRRTARRTTACAAATPRSRTSPFGRLSPMPRTRSRSSRSRRSERDRRVSRS